jgi:ADP-ribose pyrophosphatase YjhB (NUDIX family)
VGILDGWTFCPLCGASLVPGEGHVSCPACGWIGWANSVPAVQAIAELDGRLLLVRRALEPGLGKWDFPGGFLDEGEHPLDGLRRELREETGLEFEVGEFAGAWLDPYLGRTVLGLTWYASALPGEARAADDVAELRWFRADELPKPDEFAFPSHPGVAALWAARQAGTSSASPSNE